MGRGWLGADIATLKDIHAAYVRGSVPTAAQESDDILNQTFTDEVRTHRGQRVWSVVMLGFWFCSRTVRTARRWCPTRT